MCTADKITAFTSYEGGWCFGRGDAFTASTVERSLRLNTLAVLRGLKTDAFPGRNGSITLALYDVGPGDYALEVLPRGGVILSSEFHAEPDCDYAIPMSQASAEWFILHLIRLRKVECS